MCSRGSLPLLPQLQLTLCPQIQLLHRPPAPSSPSEGTGVLSLATVIGSFRRRAGRNPGKLWRSLPSALHFSVSFFFQPDASAPRGACGSRKREV